MANLKFYWENPDSALWFQFMKRLVEINHPAGDKIFCWDKNDNSCLKLVCTNDQMKSLIQDPNLKEILAMSTSQSLTDRIAPACTVEVREG